MSWPTKEIGKLCRIEKGAIGISKAIPGDYPLVVTSEERKTHNEYQFDEEAVVIPLVSSTGHGHKSLKRIHYQTGKFAVGSILCAVIPNDKSVLNTEFLFRFLYLNKERELVSRMKGMANVTLPMKEIAKIQVPIPPFDEQENFVERYKTLEESNNELSDEIVNQLDLVKQLRQAFLREAMQGKLTAKWRKENWDVEPASELLKKINAEKEKLVKEGKIKKQKPLPPIKEDEIPFEIPESWVWCRLGDVTLYSEAGKSLKALDLPAEKGQWGVIKTSSITSGIFNECENKSFLNFTNNYKNLLIQKGDILFCRASGSKELTGTSCIVRVHPISNLILSDKSIRYHFSKLISKEFIQQYNLSQFSRNYYENLGTKKSTSMNNVTREQFNSLLIPLVPLPEQQQIVTKLDELMHYCDKLEESIKASRQQNEMLLQQVLREALEPVT